MITRSESIKQLHRLKADITNGLAFVSKTKDKHLALESLDMAIQALEQDKQKVLDKIRAEIKALSPEPTAYDVVDGNPIKDAVWETLADVLQIIDKYKAESEQ